MTLLLLGAVATGAGFLTRSLAMKDEPKRSLAGPQAKPVAPAPGRMFVTGRVLDPQGQPVPNARAMAYARSKALGHSPSLSRMSPIPIGDARANPAGQFRLDAPRTSSARYDTFGAVAIAPGYGAGWVELDPDAEQSNVEITLRPEQVIEGRLFDVQGRPAPGVTVLVRLLGRVVQPGGGRAGLDKLEAVFWWGPHATALPAWPQPAMTDDQGRFTLRGVGQGLRVALWIDDPRFAHQQIMIDTDGAADLKQLTMALEPAKIIKGRVTYADTGQPVPHALLYVAPLYQGGSGGGIAEFEADDDGRFRANPYSGDGYSVRAYPPAAQPYLSKGQRFDWPKGAIEHSLDLALPRGVSIHGKVTEEGSGQPIAGATVRFIADAQRQDNADSSSGSTVLDTAADGSFRFGALPSPGFLAVMGPSDDYVYQETGGQMVRNGQPGGRRSYSHAIIRLDLKPGIRDREVHLSLRRGITVKGQVIGPDGQPVGETWLISRVILEPAPGPWRFWWGDEHGIARNGRFEIHGLDPNVETPVYFLEPKRKLGATVVFSGKSVALMTIATRTGRVGVGATAGFSGESMGRGPVTVRLEPCGAAKGRLINPDGKPVAGWRIRPNLTTMVVTPGPTSSLATVKEGVLFADEGALTVIDPTNHGNPLVSDADGRIVLPALIPGAIYRIIDRTTLRDSAGPQVRKEFTVKPGQTFDLGEIRIEKPQVLMMK
jgi:protocatechuate 3,4-dioxygenase beta subunit